MAGSVKFEIRGTKEFLARLAKANEAAQKGAQRGLVKFGEMVATDAKRRTPVDTGTLRSTVHRRDGKDVLEQLVVAGPMPSDAIDTGPANKYAIIVHENLQARHPVGEAKYIERAMDSLSGKLESIVGGEIQKALS